jgi:hypothetical protein
MPIEKSLGANYGDSGMRPQTGVAPHGKAGSTSAAMAGVRLFFNEAAIYA